MRIAFDLAGTLIALGLAPHLAACARTARTGYLHRANELVDEGNCAAAMGALSASESLGFPADEDEAQISFLKAQCFQQMRKTPDAIGLYEFLVARAPDSPYAYRAKARLEAMRAAAAHAGP